MSISLNNMPTFNINNKELEINRIKNDYNLLSINYIKDKIRINLYNKYENKNDLKYQYLGLIMQNLIFNKNTHLVSVFKDYMIVDYIEEFLKRFYTLEESNYKLPQFSSFYKNYLKFFCSPIIKNLNINYLIHNRCEKKAEFFYNANYVNKKDNNSTSEHNNGVCEDSDSSEQEEENENENSFKKTLENNTFFDDKIIKKIEKNTPINSSMALPESGSKLKKDESGLLESESNQEESLIKIAYEIGKGEENTFNLPTLNTRKNKTQTLGNKKIKKRINNDIREILSDNNKKIYNKNYSEKKFKLEKNNNKCNNIDNYNKNFKNNLKINNTLKKIGSQKLKILLNKNKGILKSKSNKKINKKNGLWDLLRDRETINIKSHNSNNTNDGDNMKDLGKKHNDIFINKNRNKNFNISYISLTKNKSTKKFINKLSPNNKNVNIVQNKRLHHQKNYNRNINLTNNNSNYVTFEKCDFHKKYLNNIGLSKKKIELKNNGKIKNQIELLINKNNEFNSIKKRSLNKKKILLKKYNKNRINITRNINNNKISLFSLTNNYMHSNNSKLNLSSSNKNIKNCNSNNDLTSKSNNIRNLKFFNTSSSILDFLKISKFQNKNKKIINNNNQFNVNKSNHIHNVNININNQINIRFNQLKDLASFIRNTKKNRIKKGVISRNKNRSLDFHFINQNIINKNYSTFFFNNRKKDNLAMIKNNKIMGLKYKKSFSRNSKINYNIESINSNIKDKKPKTNYHCFFNSLKSLNNNTKI